MTKCKLKICCALFKIKQAPTCAALSIRVHPNPSAQQYHGPFLGSRNTFPCNKEILHSCKEVGFKQYATNVILQTGLL